MERAAKLTALKHRMAAGELAKATGSYGLCGDPEIPVEYQSEDYAVEFRWAGLPTRTPPFLKNQSCQGAAASPESRFSQGHRLSHCHSYTGCVYEMTPCPATRRRQLSIPRMGNSIPIMGRRKTTTRRRRESSLADALFSTTQQRVLGFLFGQPERSFYATELIGLAGAGSGAVQRELARLEQSGLVTVRRLGTQKHYQANPESPLFNELVGIARKTVGLAEPLREALAPLASRVIAAFVYGSVAKRRDTAASDIDLMVVSDSLTYADVFGALEPLAARLGRTINPTVYSRRELARRRKEDNAFVTRVLAQDKVWIVGAEDGLPA